MRKRLIVIAALCYAAALYLYDEAFDEFTQEIVKERQLQFQQWGGAEHDMKHTAYDWCLIIVKHVGKLVSEVI